MRLAADPVVPTTAKLFKDTPGGSGGENLERARIQSQLPDYSVFVHGWRMQRWERLAFAESAYKRMFWSGYKGQFGFFDWPTDYIDNPVKDAGNFDRSEFVAWKSAAGLSDALTKVRSYLGTDGKLSVMAHSMGNVVLSEALYLYETQATESDKLADTVIMSQAAISSHYFTARTDLLPAIYKDDLLPLTKWLHIQDRVVQHSDPAWTTYRGFQPDGQDLDVIGGMTPRFRGISVSAGHILNYYNPDDYALGTWKVDQALKPTTVWSNPLALKDVKSWVDLGNVDLGGVTYQMMLDWLYGRPIPGFSGATYSIRMNASLDYEVVRHVSGRTDVVLTYAANKYEMFAFGASSIVAALGGVDDMGGLGGVFDLTASQNLKALIGTTAFNAQNTGHSAQFVHSYSSVAAYWRKLLGDIQ